MAISEQLLHGSCRILEEKELRDVGRNLGQAFKHQVVATVLAKHGLEHFRAQLCQLLVTAYQADLSFPHRIAACNALCGFVDQCASSEHQPLNELICRQPVCENLLTVYINRFESARAKSMKQVLDTILRTLIKLPPAVKSHSVANVLQTLLETVCEGDDYVKARPCFHALSSMLGKHIIDPQSLLLSFDESFEAAGPPSARLQSGKQHRFERLLRRVFDWVPRGDTAAVVAQFVTALLKRLSDSELEHQLPTSSLINPLLEAIYDDFANIQAFTVHIFPAIFKTGLDQYWCFLEHLGVRTYFGPSASQVQQPQDTAGKQAIVLCSSLQAGKQLGLIEICDDYTHEAVIKTEKAIMIIDRSIGQLTLVQEPSIRLSGLSILASSHQSSKPLTEGALLALKRALPDCFTEPDAYFRGEVFSILQSLLDRIKAATAVMHREIEQSDRQQRPADRDRLQLALDKHKDFLYWLRERLFDDLQPCASYQRHISALKGLIVLIKSGVDSSVELANLSKNAKSGVQWCFDMRILSPELLLILMDRVMDPFDDVRQLSATALKMCHRMLTAAEEQRFFVAATRAQSAMLQSGRIDHADGYARLYELRFFLESRKDDGLDDTDSLKIVRDNVNSVRTGIALAQRSLSAAVDSHPLHGQLTSLRYVLEGLFKAPRSLEIFNHREPDFLTTMVKIQYDLWECVQGLLCNDAPEGYLPEDMDDDADRNTKDVLSYAWRALKEASLLLRTVVLNLEQFHLAFPEKRLSTMTMLGDLCFNQLAELRHRGAFSTVAQTFAVVCAECLSSTDKSIGLLTDFWYQCTLDLIQMRGAKITRRSAGLPAMIVALLAAGKDFAAAVRDLKQIATVSPDQGDRGFDLPQVHALNCLKATFVSSKLVVQSEAHMVEVMGLAATSLSSKLWPIRNCGLMLFRGLVDRLLGSHESFDEAFAATPGSTLAYDRFPGLLDLFTGLLRRYASNQDPRQQAATESIFPVLDLFRRAPPPAASRAEIEPLIIEAMASPQWHIREIAARTYAAMAGGDPNERIQQLLDFPDFQENTLHGRLLAIKHVALIPNLWSEHGRSDIASILSHMSGLADAMNEFGSSPILVATLLEITNVLKTQLFRTDEQVWKLTQEPFQHLGAVASVISASSHHTSPGQLNLTCALAITHLLDIALAQKASTMEQLLDSTEPPVTPQDRAVEAAKRFNIDILSLERCLDDRLAPGAATPEELLIMMLAIEILLGKTAAHVDPDRVAVLHRAWVALWDLLVAQPDTRYQPDERLFNGLNITEDLARSASPEEYQSGLMMCGYCVDIKYACQRQPNSLLVGDMLKWIAHVRAALHEANDFPMRYAAAKSLTGMAATLERFRILPERLQLHIMFALSSALNDDDEDIRVLTAKTTTRLLSEHMAVGFLGVLSPGRAANYLAGLMFHLHPRSSMLATEACMRMTGRPALSETEAATVFQDIAQENTQLFAVEKFNLYIDAVKEGRVWSCGLKRMCAEALSPAVVNSLRDYTTRALSSIHERLMGAPLDAGAFSAREEVFAFGRGALCGAAVLLRWRRAHRVVRAIVAPAAVACIRARLYGIRTLDVHPHWQALVDRTLHDDLWAGFRQTALVVAGVGREVEAGRLLPA